MLLANGRIYTMDPAGSVVDALVIRDGRVAFAGRAADVNVPASEETRPTCTSDMAWAAERLGPDRIKGAYAWRSLLAIGVVIPGGSDFPIESPNPFHGIYAAVAHRPPTGEDRGWQPEQRMTREEAVRSFTSWNAYASRREA